MTYGFLEKTLDTRSSNGRDDTLLSELHFRDTNGDLYRCPKEATTDGGSQPGLIGLIPGFEPLGKHWFEYVTHDCGYRGTLEIQRFNGRTLTWEKANLTRSQCDALLKRSLALRKANPAVYHTVWAGVRIGGWRHYRKP